MRYSVDYVEHSSAWLEVDIPDNADPEQWIREHWELVREQLEKDGSELEINPVRTVTEQEDRPAAKDSTRRKEETEMATEPEAIRFIKDRKWPGTDSRILDIPWDEIVNACIGAWQDLEDQVFSGNVLPDALGKQYFSLLGNEDATQEDWDAFSDRLRDHVGDMSYSQLADWYVQLNDPNTIRIVLYLRDGIEYVDEECTTPWKQDR